MKTNDVTGLVIVTKGDFEYANGMSHRGVMTVHRQSRDRDVITAIEYAALVVNLNDEAVV
ncbi:MAG TPA: hypothetical protein VH561_13725 [Micromonosporaceae bacterium]